MITADLRIASFTDEQRRFVGSVELAISANNGSKTPFQLSSGRAGFSAREEGATRRTTPIQLAKLS
jgi:hypothetical protein